MLGQMVSIRQNERHIGPVGTVVKDHRRKMEDFVLEGAPAGTRMKAMFRIRAIVRAVG
jgi:hypothetical protein